MQIALVSRVGRHIDKIIDRRVPNVEIDRGHRVALAGQPVRQRFQVLPSEEYGFPVIDGFVVGRVIELRRVDRNAARFQQISGSFHKPQPVGDRTQMLEGANRPAKIELTVPLGRDVVHIGKFERDQAAELVLID